MTLHILLNAIQLNFIYTVYVLPKACSGSKPAYWLNTINYAIYFMRLLYIVH